MNSTHHDRPPQEKVCGYEYTVRRGDSFYLIANRLGVPLRDLLEANSDINPARLTVGDVLCIPMEEDDRPPVTPEAPAVPESPAQPESPVIPESPTPPESSTPPEQVPEPDRPNEPLPDLDENLDLPATMPEDGVDPDFSFCPEADRYTVIQGDTAADVQLRRNINRYTLQTANPTADLDHLTPGQKLCVPRESITCPAASTYVLQKEDTLESVALRMNTSLGALLRANPCLAPSDFTEGRCIALP